MSSGVEAVANLVLDTSAYAWMRRGHGRVLDWIAAAQVVSLPITVLGELEAGFAAGSRTQENRATLSDFLREPWVVVRPTSHAVARAYGSILTSLRKAGTPIPTNDLWIAAETRWAGGHLLTFDRHFSRVEALDHTILEVSDPEP